MRHRFTAVRITATLTVVLLSWLVFPLAASHGPVAASTAIFTAESVQSPSAAESEPIVSIGEARIEVDEIGTVEVAIREATAGLSGYDITVSLSDDEVAEIVGIVMPDFGLTDETISSPSSARIRAVDLNEIVPLGTSEAQLAVLEVKGLKPGISEVTASIYAMDDDNGDPIEPRILWGSVRVTLVVTPTPEPSVANWPLIGGIIGILVIGLCVGLFTIRRRRIVTDKASPNETESTD